MKTATARGTSTRSRVQTAETELSANIEPRVTFDIHSRNDVSGNGEAYRIYQLEGDSHFFVDKVSEGESSTILSRPSSRLSSPLVETARFGTRKSSDLSAPVSRIGGFAAIAREIFGVMG